MLALQFSENEVKDENTNKENLMLKIRIFVSFSYSLDGQRAQLNHQVQTDIHREGSSLSCSLQVRAHPYTVIYSLLHHVDCFI